MDRSIQRSLLLAMVGLEVVLMAVTAWIAHRRLILLIDDNMYRMSLSQTGPTLLRLAQESFPVLAVFVAVNLIALLAAASIWSHKEDRVLQYFAGLVRKTRELDFTGDADVPPMHEVLELAVTWRARERARFAAIREQVEKLGDAAKRKGSTHAMRTAADRLNELLP